MVKAAGAPFGIQPGTPNQMERIESGLLSFGTDTDRKSNPLELVITKMVHLDAPDDVIGIAALRTTQKEGVRRRQMGILLHATTRHLYTQDIWCDVLKNGHSSVWGSWFDTKTFSWGYRCCQNTLENAYCTATE